MYTNIELLKAYIEKDALKIEKKTVKINNVVIGEIKSVSRTEFHAAAKNGVKADIMAEIWSCEYSGENYARVEGATQIYSVYRTYVKGDKLEIYLTPVKNINLTVEGNI